MLICLLDTESSVKRSTSYLSVTESDRLAGDWSPGALRCARWPSRPGHPLRSVISAKLWLLPAEKAAHEPRRRPPPQAMRGPPQAPAQSAFGAAPVVLMRLTLVAAPAQHGAASPDLHG